MTIVKQLKLDEFLKDSNMNPVRITIGIHLTRGTNNYKMYGTSKGLNY